MKKLLIITVSSMATLTGTAHALPAQPTFDSDALQVELNRLIQQSSTSPAAKLYNGDFQKLAKSSDYSKMYAGYGSKKMITTKFLVY